MITESWISFLLLYKPLSESCAGQGRGILGFLLWAFSLCLGRLSWWKQCPPAEGKAALAVGGMCLQSRSVSCTVTMRGSRYRVKCPALRTTSSGWKYQGISQGRWSIAGFEGDSNLNVILFAIITGILSTLGNGYVIFMSSKRKKKLRPAEIMTVNLAVCDLGISGNSMFLFSLIFTISPFCLAAARDIPLQVMGASNAFCCRYFCSIICM